MVLIMFAGNSYLELFKGRIQARVIKWTSLFDALCVKAQECDATMLINDN